MVTDIEFACLVVACTLAGLSYFYNAKYNYYYLQKSKSVAFLAVLAFQLFVLLGVRYLNVQYEIYYLLPFNIFYSSVFYHGLLKISTEKVPKDYLLYSILIILLPVYVFVLQNKSFTNLKLYYLLYQSLLFVFFVKSIIKYLTITRFESAPKVTVKWYFQSLVTLSVIETALFFYNMFSSLELLDIKIISIVYLIFIVVTFILFIAKPIVFINKEDEKVIQKGKVEKEPDIKNTKLLPNIPQEKEKYQKSKLKEEDIILIKKKIQRIVDEKLFLDPELNLEQLSDYLKVPKYSLSQVFSSVCATNFKDYINYLRCEYALQFILKENLSQNIIEIAYQSGFNSKTSFYRAFNKIYKCTPLEYKQQVLN